MTVASFAALFGTLLLLGLMPTTSSWVVAARSSMAGRGHGMLAAAGVATGDATFVTLAVLGLASVVSELGPWLQPIRYVAAAYIGGLGIVFLRARPAGVQERRVYASSSSSFLAGLLITLADQKAIFFYLGLFPAYVDPAALNAFEVGATVSATALAVGVAKLVYAMAGNRAHTWLSPVLQRGLSTAAGIVLLGVAVVLVVRG